MAKLVFWPRCRGLPDAAAKAQLAPVGREDGRDKATPEMIERVHERPRMEGLRPRSCPSIREDQRTRAEPLRHRREQRPRTRHPFPKASPRHSRPRAEVESERTKASAARTVSRRGKHYGRTHREVRSYLRHRSSADATAISEAAGAFVSLDPPCLQSTGFVLDLTGKVLSGVYSCGATGQLIPDDVLEMVRDLLVKTRATLTRPARDLR